MIRESKLLSITCIIIRSAILLFERSAHLIICTEMQLVKCMYNMCCVSLYLPEDAKDHNSCGKRNEGNTVADGVADLHLPEKLALMEKKKRD